MPILAKDLKKLVAMGEDESISPEGANLIRKILCQLVAEVSQLRKDHDALHRKFNL